MDRTLFKPNMADDEKPIKIITKESFRHLYYYLQINQMYICLVRNLVQQVNFQF